MWKKGTCGNTWNSSLKDSSFLKTKPKDKIYFTFSSSPQQTHHQIHKAPHPANAPPYPNYKLQTKPNKLIRIKTYKERKKIPREIGKKFGDKFFG